MYNNFIINHIISWLLKNGCNNPKEAVSTESKYVMFGENIIRISEHLPCNIQAKYIYIVVPSDNKHAFGVFIYRKYSTFNTVSELKSFLKSLFIVLDCEYNFDLRKGGIPSQDKIIENLRNKVKKQANEIKELKK